MPKKLISVVVPIYNAEDSLRYCLDSVLQQTYNFIQIVLVDDGSTDGSGAICEEYVKKDSRVILVKSEHMGVSCARNMGIDRSIGEYITFVDADDSLNPELFGKYISCVNILESLKKSVAWYMCGMKEENYSTVNSAIKDNILSKEECGKHFTGFDRGIGNDSEIIILKRNSIPVLSWKKLFNFVTNKLYIAEKIKRNNIRFSPEVKNAEDLLFNLEYLEKVEGCFGMINRPLYHYIRRNRTGLSLSYYPNATTHTRQIYSRLLEFYSSVPESSEDGLLVLEAEFITDWTSRMVTRYTTYKNTEKKKQVLKMTYKELNSDIYQNMLKRVRKAKKISLLRYLPLRFGLFKHYIILRKEYHSIKYRQELLVEE